MKPENRQLLVTLLAPFGFDLREAENDQEAIDIWIEWELHVDQIRRQNANLAEASAELVQGDRFAILQTWFAKMR